MCTVARMRQPRPVSDDDPGMTGANPEGPSPASDASGVSQRNRGSYLISADPERFDADAFHRFLSRHAYWARGRSREITAAAVANSLVFGAYAPDGAMVGAARVVTDWATFGWVCDVYVLEPHRGRGLGKALLKAVCEHPGLAGVKRLVLVTLNAHRLYGSFGFKPLEAPERWMELCRPPT